MTPQEIADAEFRWLLVNGDFTSLDWDGQVSAALKLAARCIDFVAREGRT